jgi:3-hydroxyisobutyrate dehydrogenase-like beta-hydroxyacid dehydrogenase
MTASIGVIGLGIMGGAFARNLVASGWNVVGCDLEAARREEARAAGVEVVDTVAAVTEACGDIITSLPTPAAVLDTARAIAGFQGKPRVVIETSTLSLADKGAALQILGEAGHAALDCPISGAGSQAMGKDIVVYASGDAATIKRLDAVFLGFARKVYDLGAFGNGSKMKFIANHLVAIHNVAAAEAMVLGMKAGLDPHQIVDVVGAGAGTSRVFELRAPMMAESTYLPATMRSTTWTKDLTVIGDFAAALSCPTPVFSLSASLHEGVLATGRGAEDTAAVCEVYAQMAGLDRKRRG